MSEQNKVAMLVVGVLGISCLKDVILTFNFLLGITLGVYVGTTYKPDLNNLDPNSLFEKFKDLKWF